MAIGREKPSGRTAAAVSELGRALGADLTAAAISTIRAIESLGHRLTLLLGGGRGRVAGAATPARRASVRPSSARIAGRSLRRLLWLATLASIAFILIACCALLWALLGLPIGRPTAAATRPALLLEAANGEPLGQVGPLQVADVPLKDMSPLLINAVLSVEDRRFFDHPGIDVRGIFRAAEANRLAGEIVQGASTITQQLVKLDYLPDDRSYVFKLRQALMAIWLEMHSSKDEILDRYLNRVYLGEGAVGMGAAAKLYFNKPAAALDLAQAALLAGLIQAPSEFDPLRHPHAAEARAATVLDAMVANHVITAAAANAAKAQPAVAHVSPELAPAQSWFADWVAKPAAALAGPQPGGARVVTTLRPDLQSLAQQVLDEALAKDGPRLGVSEGALVAMRPDGAVLAMVGGRNYQKSPFNRAADSNRQPGSSFKLFVYLAALRQGYQPQDKIDGGPIDIHGWKPANFDNEHYARITLADAFAHSVNTAAARLAMKVGMDNVIAAARDLGITEPLPDVPSLALGTAGVSLVDMTGAFASVSADHMHVRPWGVAAVGPADGSRMLATVPATAPQTLDPYRKPLVELLQDVVEHGTGQKAALDGFAAGKTGTSQDYRDAWFLGFNDKLVAGVWLGNDDDAPMKKVVGGGLPAEIWKAFMTRATPMIEQGPARVAAAAGGAAAQGDNAAGEGSSGQPQAPLCDMSACAAKYHSFNAADCTYQPYGGGARQMCEIAAALSATAGGLGSSAAAGGSGSSTAAESSGSSAAAGSSSSSAAAESSGSSAAPAQCHVDACAKFYSSFDRATCTYQPYGGGPRQLCEK